MNKIDEKISGIICYHAITVEGGCDCNLQINRKTIQRR